VRTTMSTILPILLFLAVFAALNLFEKGSID
jgi:hypothetical protein